MAHAPNVPMKPALHPGVVLALFLTGAVSFALGQNWPPVDVQQNTIAAPEDWHGNVKRSEWGRDR